MGTSRASEQPHKSPTSLDIHIRRGSSDTRITCGSMMHSLDVVMGSMVPMVIAHPPGRDPSWGAFHQAFCQWFSLTNFISYWNPCIWLAESKFVSEKHWPNAWWNAPQDILHTTWTSHNEGHCTAGQDERLHTHHLTGIAVEQSQRLFVWDTSTWKTAERSMSALVWLKLNSFCTVWTCGEERWF